MKKLIAVPLIALALLGLAGCSGLSKDDVEGMSKLKTACEDAGGEFTTWVTDVNTGQYKCDLSTNPKEDR